MLGLYVSDHPLFGSRRRCAARSSTRSPTSPSWPTARTVHIGGVITGLTRKFTKKGDQMAVFVLEDLEANIEVTLFPRTLQEHGHKLRRRRRRRRQGPPRPPRRGPGQPDLPVGRGAPGPRHGPAPPLRLRIPATALDELTIQRLKRILRDHPGDSLVMLDIGTQVLRLPTSSASTSTAPSASCAWPSATTPCCCRCARDRAVSDASRSRRSGRKSPTNRRGCGLASAGRRRWAPPTCKMCVPHLVAARGERSGQGEGTWQSRCKRTTRRPSPTPTSTNWRRWVERSASASCRRPRRTGSSSPRPASTASCTASRSPRSSASAARRACCSG